MSSSGAITFMLSTMLCYTLASIRPNVPVSVEKLSLRKTEIPIAKIPRCESEFSLGLSRNLSVSRELSEFGKLCDAGELAIMLASCTLRVVVGSALLYKLYIKLTNKNQDR